MKKKEQFISIPDIAELYGADPSQLRKMLKKLEIKPQKIRRASDNRIVTVITDEEHQHLVNEQANLTAPKLGKNDITVADACKKLGFREDQMSNLTRWCKSLGIKYSEKKKNGRTQKTLNKKDFEKLLKIRKSIVTLDA